jgi:hypothetical protein
MEEPPNPSSVAEPMRLSAKLVFAEVFAEVCTEVPAAVSSEVEDPLDQKLSLAFVGVLLVFPVIVFVTNGEVGALGEDGPTALSTLRSKRRPGSGSDDVRVSVKLAQCGGWRTR